MEHSKHSQEIQVQREVPFEALHLRARSLDAAGGCRGAEPQAAQSTRASIFKEGSELRRARAFADSKFAQV